jgi:hypothetical protein
MNLVPNGWEIWENMQTSVLICVLYDLYALDGC